MNEDELASWEKVFAVADKVVERRDRGIPQDRWMLGLHEMDNFVQAYKNLSKLCGILAADLRDMQSAMTQIRIQAENVQGHDE